MQALYLERVRAVEARADTAPRELQELDARLARLRDRVQRGDPDMAADGLQAAVERAEAKRADLRLKRTVPLSLTGISEAVPSTRLAVIVGSVPLIVKLSPASLTYCWTCVLSNLYR